MQAVNEKSCVPFLLPAPQLLLHDGAQVADMIDAAQRKERVRRGIHVESV